jgi:predicted nucleic acid-binding protein
MARDIFVDTGGWFALLIRRDLHHSAARRELDQAKHEQRRFVTTDHVLGETATLFKARREGHLAEVLFETVFESMACRVEWTGEARFANVRAYFLKHSDQAWSFTDCLSFCVMKELRLQEALTTDVHFEQAGFVALLK